MLVRFVLGITTVYLFVGMTAILGESGSLRVLSGEEENAARASFDNANQLLIKYRKIRNNSPIDSPAAVAAFDKAFSAYDKIIQSCPNTGIEAQSLIGLCNLYYAKGDYRRVSSVMDRIEKGFAGTEYVDKAYMSLGLRYLQDSHDPAGALSCFKKIQLPPLPDANDTSAMGRHNRERSRKKYVTVYELMAKCEIWLGEPEKAAEYYEKLGKMFPELKDEMEHSLESEVESVLTETSRKKVWPTLSAWRQARRKSRAGDWLQRHEQDKAAAEEEKWGKEVGGLRWSIEMEQTSHRVGDQFTITINIKNISKKSVILYYQDVYQAEKLIVKSEKGEVIESQKMLMYTPPNPKDSFELIEPGGVFTRQIEGRVTMHFVGTKDLIERESSRSLMIDFRDVAVLIGESGRFTVSLRLAADEKTVGMGKQFGFEDVWTGELLSNELEFSVRLMNRKELDRAIEQLCTGDVEQKNEAIEIVKANCDKQAVKALMTALHSGGNLNLRALSGALIRIQDTSVVPDLLEMYRLSVRYGSERDRERQSIILQTIKGLEADNEKIDELFADVLKSEASINARQYAAYELGMRYHPEGLAALIEAARRREPRMQWAAIDALGILGSRLDGAEKEVVIKALVEILRNDPNRKVRQRSVSALAKAGGSSVSGELIKALKDSDPYVRNSAAIYLGRYGGPEAVSPLKEYLSLTEEERFKRVAEEAIKFIGQRAGSKR